MNAILPLINALLPFALAELQQYAKLSPDYATLITGIVGATESIVPLFDKGNPVTASSVLSALQSSISALQGTKADGTELAMTQAFLKAVQAGIDANSALTAVLPDHLQPIVPLP